MEPSSYSGAGGKIRRGRPSSRASASTPYDRPPAAAAAHRLAAAAAAATGSTSAAYQGPAGGWVFRLVDPASRLIAGGAARLFSTVFRKRLAPAPAPPAPEAPLSAHPGRDAEPRQDLPESTHIDLTLADGMAKGKDPVGASGDKALSEVEHLLMRKTFTRVEFDRLTDLLRARTVEPDLSAQVDHLVDTPETRTRIDGTGGSTSHGMAVDHSPPADVPIRGARSPVDLAKQYMSSRYLKEPQPSSLRRQVFPGNKAEAGNTGYYKTSGAPLVQEPKEFNNENPGLPLNGYMASELRGRSAICRMSRSPYFKGPSSSSDMNASPFSSSHARSPSLATDGRQVLKRRGTDFENERGSIGPIRRIRQKTNMMSHFKDSNVSPRGNFPSSRTIGSGFAEGSSPLQESPSSKRLLLESGKSLWAQRNSEGGKSSTDNVPPVPPRPNKMAEKIFEQLNIIAPSPKDKQSRQQSVAGNPSQSMSKQPVWQDNGPKGLSDPSSSRQFQNGDRPNDSDLNGSTLNKDRLKKDGSSKVPSNTFQDSGNQDIKSDHAASFNMPAISGNSVPATTSRKPGFKMAVFEDLYEFDDDQEAPVQSKKSILETEVKTTGQKFNSKVKERKVQHNEQKVELTLSKENAVSSSVSEQPRTSTSKDVSTSGLFSSSDPEKKATPHVPANNNIGFTFPHVPPGDNTEASGSAVPLASNKDNKQTSASPFMFGAKPSSTSDLETSTTAGVKTEGRLGESIAKPTSLDNTNLERSNGRERAGDIHKSPDKVIPTAPPTSTPPLHFASAASTPSLSNGMSHASPPKLSNVMPTDKPAVSSSPFTNIASFAVSSSSPPISSSVPAFPTINFGSSTSAVAAAKSESTFTETKPASTSFFGTVGTSTEGKSVAPEPASKTSSNLNTSSIFSSNVTTFSNSPVTSSSTFSSTPTLSSSHVASSGVGIATTNSAPSTTLATAPGVQSASAPAFAFSSSGNSLFGFSSPAQSTGLSTTVGGSTSQASAASMVFGSKLPQPQGAMSESSATPFSPSFPTVATGAAASSLGSGTVSFGAVASPSAPGTLFGAGASSSGPGTVSFGVGASSSGPGSVSIGVGASSSGPGLFSFGAGVSSSGPGTVSFGAAPSSSRPGTVSFGATTSSSGPVFGNSPFGAGAAFSGSGSGFAFSSPSSSAASSLTVASTSMFSSSTTASSSAAFSNPFGSTSSTPSMFAFGQPAASSGAGFSFGAQSAPAFSSPSPPVFSFTSASMNSSTPQPAFGMTSPNTGFGMGSPGNDQMNMEDSMADDTNQAAPPQVSAPVFGSSVFGQPASSAAAPVFGAPAAVQPAGVFQFGGQQAPAQQQNPSFAPAGGSLEFQGGNFSLGSTGGGDKSNRRIIKAKRRGAPPPGRK